MAEWTETAEATLVELWVTMPCLYDTSSKGYSSRVAKRNAYEELCAATKMSEAQIRKHMASLRTQYSRTLKSRPSGSAAKKTTKRQDWLQTNLSFLKPFLKKRTSSSNLELGSPDSEESENEDGDSSNKDDSPSRDDNYDREGESTSSEGAEANPSTPRSTKRPTSTSTKSTEKKMRASQETRDEELEVLRSVGRILSEPEKEKDADDIFGNWVASHLHQLKEGRAKVMAKKIISDTLFNASLEMESQPVHQTHYGNSSNAAVPTTSTANYNFGDNQYYSENLPLMHDHAPTYMNLDYYNQK